MGLGKKKKTGSPLRPLNVLHLYHMQILFETFHKVQKNRMCAGAHKRVLIHFGL